MITVRLLLLVLALLCFLIAALRISHPKVDFVACGLALWLLAQLVV